MRSRVPALLLGAAAVLLGCGEGSGLAGWKALPAYPEGTVAFYGDSRTGHDVHRELVAGIVSVAPTAVLHSGDLVEEGGDGAMWGTFASITAPLRAVAPMYPARGNHDVGGTLFAEAFSLPASTLWYAADAGGAHVIVLDTEFSLAADSPQVAWLNGHLASLGSSKPFRVVVFHYPLFSTATHGGDEIGHRAVLEPIFRANGVDLVINGHDHDYERTVHDGVTYLVSGGGGAPLYPQATTSPESVVFASVNHFGLIYSHSGRWRVEVWSPGPVRVDTFDLTP